MRLEALAVLFGPNAAGKSNFLDALQLLSKLGTSRTVKEAFDPPYRGKPIESFTIGNGGLKGLIEVKGRASDGAIQMDANERKQACHLGERYWLYAVFDCATPAPRLLRVQNPFAKLLASRLDAGGGGEGLTEGVR